MIVHCTNCPARYALDPAKLGTGGRKVKCAKCGHVWFQEPEKPNEPDVISPDADLKPREIFSDQASMPAVRKPPIRRLPVQYAAVSVLLVFTSFVSALLAYKENVVSFWEPSALLYDILGMPVAPPGTGLSFSEIEVKTYEQGGRIALLVSGAIVNTTAQLHALPTLLLTVRDASERNILKWFHALPQEQIRPGGMINFKTQQYVTNELANNLIVEFSSYKPKL